MYLAILLLLTSIASHSCTLCNSMQHCATLRSCLHHFLSPSFLPAIVTFNISKPLTKNQSGETTNMPAMQNFENEASQNLWLRYSVSKPDSFCSVTNSFVDCGKCNLLKTIIVKYWHRSGKRWVVNRDWIVGKYQIWHLTFHDN